MWKLSLFKIEITFGKVEDTVIVKMLKFPDFIFPLLLPGMNTLTRSSQLLPNFEKK